MTRALAVLVVLVGLCGLVGCKTQVAVTPKPCAEEVATEAAVTEKPAPEPVKATVAPAPPAPKPTVEAPKPEPPAPKPEEAKPKPEPPAPKPEAPKAEEKPAEAPKAEEAAEPAEAKPEAPAPKAEEKPAEATKAEEATKAAEAKPEAPAPKVEEKPAEAPKAEEAPKPAPPKPKAELPKPKPLGDVAAKTWEVPGSADAAGWAVMTWGNPAVLSQEEGAVKVECQGGEEDKASVGIRLTPAADLSSRTALVLDITNGNAEAGKVALAVLTKGGEYFESKPKTIEPGANKAVDFDLKAKDYKAKATGWEFSAAIANLDNTSTLCLVIYGKGKGTVTISNVALTAD